MRSKKFPEGGFTLVEMIIVVALAGLIGILIMSILVNNTGVFYRETTRVQQGMGLNDSIARIKRSFKEAKAAVSNYPVNGSPTYTSGPSEIVIELLSVNPSGEVIAGAYDYVIYTVDNGKLRYKLYPDSQSSRQAVDQILAKNVDSLIFDYISSTGTTVLPANATKVRVTIKLTQQIGIGSESNIATAEASFRNR